MSASDVTLVTFCHTLSRLASIIFRPRAEAEEALVLSGAKPCRLSRGRRRMQAAGCTQGCSLRVRAPARSRGPRGGPSPVLARFLRRQRPPRRPHFSACFGRARRRGAPQPHAGLTPSPRALPRPRRPAATPQLPAAPGPLPPRRWPHSRAPPRTQGSPVATLRSQAAARRPAARLSAVAQAARARATLATPPARPPPFFFCLW